MRHKDVQWPLPELNGLILAGGESSRMGTDKGAIEYRGQPHACYLHDLLGRFCNRVFVSVNAAQRDREPYAAMSTIVDVVSGQGPASGILAARRYDPTAAWLVVACDLAELAPGTLDALVRLRSPTAMATVFRHPDGVLEPLCAIWEPAACALLAERVAAGDASPRRCLESAEIEIVQCPDPATLRSYDSPASAEQLRRDG